MQREYDIRRFWQEARLLYEQAGPSEQGPSPESVEAGTEQGGEVLETNEDVQQSEGQRQQTATVQMRAETSRISVQEGGVQIVAVTQAQASNPETRVGRLIQQVTQPNARPQGAEQMRVGEGLQFTAEEQAVLMPLEAQYRQDLFGASSRPGFNLQQFKQEWINRVNQQLEARQPPFRVRLNMGVPAAPGLGLHTAESPYRPIDSQHQQVLLGIEQQYNQMLAARMQQGPLSLPELRAFKQQAVERFNQQIAGTNIPVRFYIGLPDSYSFGIDWNGAEDAPAQPNAPTAGPNAPNAGPNAPAAGPDRRQPRPFVTREGRQAAERLNRAPDLGEALEALFRFIEALLNAIERALDRSDRRQEQPAGGASREAVQREIDTELQQEGTTREQLATRTEQELQGRRREAEDIRGRVTRAEGNVNTLRAREQELETQARGNPQNSELQTQLSTVRGQRETAERDLAALRTQLNTLVQQQIPRLELKLRLLRPPEGGADDLTAEERQRLQQGVDQMLSAVNPEVRALMGNFRFARVNGQPVLIPTGPGVLQRFAQKLQREQIAVADLTPQNLPLLKQAMAEEMEARRAGSAPTEDSQATLRGARLVEGTPVAPDGEGPASGSERGTEAAQEGEALLARLDAGEELTDAEKLTLTDHLISRNEALLESMNENVRSNESLRDRCIANRSECLVAVGRCEMLKELFPEAAEELGEIIRNYQEELIPSATQIEGSCNERIQRYRTDMIPRAEENLRALQERRTAIAARIQRPTE